MPDPTPPTSPTKLTSEVKGGMSFSFSKDVMKADRISTSPNTPSSDDNQTNKVQTQNDENTKHFPGSNDEEISTSFPEEPVNCDETSTVDGDDDGEESCSSSCDLPEGRITQTVNIPRSTVRLMLEGIDENQVNLLADYFKQLSEKNPEQLKRELGYKVTNVEKCCVLLDLELESREEAADLMKQLENGELLKKLQKMVEHLIGDANTLLVKCFT
ncbi:uncharacterized protein LOC144350722 [Saccoglossus kowalevskii]